MLTTDEAIAWLKKQARKATQQKYADSLGVSAQYLSDVLNDRRDPEMMLRRAGWERHVFYTRKDCKICDGAGVTGIPGAPCDFCK